MLLHHRRHYRQVFSRTKVHRRRRGARVRALSCGFGEESRMRRFDRIDHMSAHLRRH